MGFMNFFFVIMKTELVETFFPSELSLSTWMNYNFLIVCLHHHRIFQAWNLSKLWITIKRLILYLAVCAGVRRR